MAVVDGELTRVALFYSADLKVRGVAAMGGGHALTRSGAAARCSAQKEDADSFVRAVLQRFLEVCQTKFAELHPKMREAAKKSAEAVRHRLHPRGQRWSLIARVCRRRRSQTWATCRTSSPLPTTSSG
jgi:hypothetical protein